MQDANGGEVQEYFHDRPDIGCFQRDGVPPEEQVRCAAGLQKGVGCSWMCKLQVKSAAHVLPRAPRPLPQFSRVPEEDEPGVRYFAGWNEGAPEIARE